MAGFNVAFVYVGPVGDWGWTWAHDQARKHLEQALPDVRTAYVESVAEGAEAEQVIRSLARKGFQLIITTSFGFMDPTETVAAESMLPRPISRACRASRCACATS